MASHSSILAWRIPWTEEPGGLQSMGSQRVGHDWSDLAHSTHADVLLSPVFQCRGGKDGHFRGHRSSYLSDREREHCGRVRHRVRPSHAQAFNGANRGEASVCV